MPTFYEGNIIAEIKVRTIKEDDFSSGYIFYEKAVGKLKMTYWYSAFCIVFAVLFAILAFHEILLYKIIAKTAVCIMFAFAGIYFAVVRVKNAEKSAKAIYEKSKLIPCPTSFKIYRDSFYIENEYENFNGYWTDIISGSEDSSKIVLISEWISRPVIIVKTDENSEQITKLSKHLQSTLISKYKIKR